MFCTENPHITCIKDDLTGYVPKLFSNANVSSLSVEDFSHQLKKELSDTFNPEEYRCGQVPKTKSLASWGQLGHMLSGHKHVWLTGIKKGAENIINIEKIYPKWRKFLKFNNINIISYKRRLTGTYFNIYYTPQGKENAYLFYTNDMQKKTNSNHYLRGYLLGYREEDIKKFYFQLNITSEFIANDKTDTNARAEYLKNPEIIPPGKDKEIFELRNKETREQFDADKKRAHAWIAQQRKWAKQKKALFIGTSIVATAIGGFIVWKYIKNNTRK